ncbi:MAG TPA: restriction endonuclease subunit S [Aequorivita sp.]|nr:restriction endonuclease subunit S [Aequorivita sp.]
MSSIEDRIPEGWVETTLGKVSKVQTGPFGSQLKNEQYITGGTPVITVEHIQDFRIQDFDYPSVTEEDKKRLSKYLLKEGDIVFTRVGSVDLSAYVDKSQDGWMFSSRMLSVRTNKEVDSKFISYFFRQNSFRKYIYRISVGATMPSINTGILKGIPISYPPIEKQKAIAQVLTAFDDKIENLRAQNDTLEEIAQTIFKEWFGNYQVGDELPEGWRVGKLGEEFDISIGRTPPRKETQWFSDTPTGKKWISIRDIGSCGVYIENTAEYLTDEAIEKFNIPVIPKNTTILSFKMTVGKLTITTEDMLSNEAIAHLKLKDGTYLTSEYIYLYLQNLDFNSLGSTSSIVTAINSTIIKNLDFIIPDKEALKKIELIINSLFEKIKNNTEQIQSLTKTRDTLLPKLMSGELRVEGFKK